MTPASHDGKARELAAAYDEWARRCDVLPWDQVRALRR